MATGSTAIWKRGNGWRQGCVLPDEAVAALRLAHPSEPERTCVIVISHDCDLAVDTPGVEDSVEVIVGRALQKIDETLTRTNPRAACIFQCSASAATSLVSRSKRLGRLRYRSQACRLASVAGLPARTKGVGDASDVARDTLQEARLSRRVRPPDGKSELRDREDR